MMLLFYPNILLHNTVERAALSGGAVCWDAKRHMQIVTSRSSALFGVFYTNDALLSLLLLSFKCPLILFCLTPIKGVLNARTAPRVRREQFFVFVPAEQLIYELRFFR